MTFRHRFTVCKGLSPPFFLPGRWHSVEEEERLRDRGRVSRASGELRLAPHRKLKLKDAQLIFHGIWGLSKTRNCERLVAWQTAWGHLCSLQRLTLASAGPATMATLPATWASGGPAGSAAPRQRLQIRQRRDALPHTRGLPVAPLRFLFGPPLLK